MPYFTVTINRGQFGKIIQYVVAPNAAEAEEKVRKTWSFGRREESMGWKITVWEDKHYLERKKEHDYWREKWHAALRNTPRRKRKSGMEDCGLTTLGRMLGYTCKGVHLLISRNTGYGCKPRDPKMAERLLKLAGPHGNIIAWFHLKKQGKDHFYIRPF